MITCKGLAGGWVIFCVKQRVPTTGVPAGYYTTWVCSPIPIKSRFRGEESALFRRYGVFRCLVPVLYACPVPSRSPTMDLWLTFQEADFPTAEEKARCCAENPLSGRSSEMLAVRTMLLTLARAERFSAMIRDRIS
jgi:hypothetical protein